MEGGVKNTNGNKSFEFVPILPRQADLSRRQATVIAAGHWHSTLLALCFLRDPDLSLQPFTTVTSGSPFELLAEPFLKRSCPKSFLLFHLAMDLLSGYFHCLATHDFLRKLPETCVPFRLTLQTSTT